RSFFFSSRRRHTRSKRDWSSDVCSSDLRYHSLAIVDETLDLEKFEVTARTEDGIVMAIEHREKPLFGVQFHPESVLTECGYLMRSEERRVGKQGGHAEYT